MALNQNLHIPFKNIIWRISPDNASDYALIESRDEQRKKVIFYGVSLTNGVISSEFKVEKNDWWVGIESVNDQKVLIHGYESDDSPIHKDLYCYDLTNGNELWRLDDHQVEDINFSTINIKSPDESIKTIDWTGQECEEEESNHSGITPKFKNPNPYFQDSDYFKTVADYVQQNFGDKPIELIEYLEWKNNIFISYYIAQNSKLTNILKVLDQHGNVVFEETLGSQLKGIGINTFFLSENQLIFTKNKTELFGFLID